MISILLIGSVLYWILSAMLLAPVLEPFTNRVITRYFDNPDWIFTPIGLAIIFSTYAWAQVFIAGTLAF